LLGIVSSLPLIKTIEEIPLWATGPKHLVSRSVGRSDEKKSSPVGLSCSGWARLSHREADIPHRPPENMSENSAGTAAPASPASTSWSILNDGVSSIDARFGGASDEKEWWTNVLSCF
jgi:hypothetical protein